MRRIQREPVHLIIKSHGVNDSSELGKHLKRARTVIFEQASGALNVNPSLVKKGTSRFTKTTFRDVARFQKAKRRVQVGEALDSPAEGKILDALARTEFLQLGALRRALWNGDSLKIVIEAAKKYFTAQAARDTFRHTLIRRTIKTSLEPVVAQYGTRHSLLSREFQQDGIPSSRDMPPQVFLPSEVVVRKLRVGKKPSDLDYKRGIVDFMFAPQMANRQQDRQYRTTSLFTSVLIRNLRESQLNWIIASGNVQRVFTDNGLPAHPTPAEIKQFVKTHSSFWKHERRARRLRNKAKNQRWNSGQQTISTKKPVKQMANEAKP